MSGLGFLLCPGHPMSPRIPRKILFKLKKTPTQPLEKFLNPVSTNTAGPFTSCPEGSMYPSTIYFGPKVAIQELSAILKALNPKP